jgi:hypothetical protein
MHSQLPNASVTRVQGKETQPAVRIRRITSKSEVPVKGNFALAKTISTQHIFNLHLSALKISRRALLNLSSLIEGPVLTSIVD